MVVALEMEIKGIPYVPNLSQEHFCQHGDRFVSVHSKCTVIFAEKPVTLLLKEVQLFSGKVFFRFLR